MQQGEPHGCRAGFLPVLCARRPVVRLARRCRGEEAWHPVANLLGLHTAYQLDRVAGRYEDIDHERTRPRTVYALAPQRPLDIYRITRRYRALAPIVDAEYGSATFVSGREPATFEVRVTTSGLLARRV